MYPTRLRLRALEYSFFRILLFLKYILQDIEQLIPAECVSLYVTTIVGLAVPTVPASPIRTTPPHLYVRLPEHREPSLLKRQVLQSAGGKILVEKTGESGLVFGVAVPRR
jgi:hypothetical protein